jgi:hypothetical protein
MELKATGLTTVIQNLYRACWHKQAQFQAKTPTWPVLISVLVLVINLAWLPFIARTWRATGDEPHYLLAAHSLVMDGDLDLANNYDRLDYLAFYFSKDIIRQVRTDAAGRQILDHHLGLPVLIAPAYLLGGRFGVLLFQAVLAGLLAWLTFKLAFALSQDERASLWATLAVVLTPPLFLYQYLVYPELIGALLTTLLLYWAITRSKPAPGLTICVVLALLILPWLNRRFIPLTILLILLVGWAWRDYYAARPKLGLVAVAVVLASIVLLFWWNSQLATPDRIDITAPPGGSQFWRRLGRGVGWLVDQQRGLFIYAPVYLLALWGLPLLLSTSLAHLRQNRAWFVLLPFLLLLGVTTLAGGFWIAWELGPRFLVVSLPAIAPLLALAWRNYGLIWRGAAVLLLGVSLAHSLVIIYNPELPYKSSLPLFYADKLGLPLVELLPDLAEYAELQPVVSEQNPSVLPAVAHDGRPAWLVAAGAPGPVIKSAPLYELPFGHYRLTWPVRLAEEAPAAAELGRISVNLLGGGQIFNQQITVADLQHEGGETYIEHSFLNTNVDRWRTPMILQAITTGQAGLWIGPLRLSPTFFYGWFLPYLYLLLMLAGAFSTWRLVGRNWLDRPEPFRLVSIPARLGWGLILLLLLFASGYLIFQQNRPSHTYPAAGLHHFVGQPVPDPQAKTGQAWRVDPRVDPPQKAIYGPFDIYDAGHYQVTFRLNLPGVEPMAGEIARLQVNATANFDELAARSLQMSDFAQPDIYQEFVLTFDNPRRQALSFDLHYSGVVALIIDQVTITQITNRGKF